METDGQEDGNMELVFHNEALLRLVGVQSTKDLHAFIAKRLFFNPEKNNRLSLLNAASGRYSDVLLRNTYKYARAHQPAQADGVP